MKLLLEPYSVSDRKSKPVLYLRFFGIDAPRSLSIKDFSETPFKTVAVILPRRQI